MKETQNLLQKAKNSIFHPRESLAKIASFTGHGELLNKDITTKDAIIGARAAALTAGLTTLSFGAVKINEHILKPYEIPLQELAQANQRAGITGGQREAATSELLQEGKTSVSIQEIASAIAKQEVDKYVIPPNTKEEIADNLAKAIRNTYARTPVGQVLKEALTRTPNNKRILPVVDELNKEDFQNEILAEGSAAFGGSLIVGSLALGRKKKKGETFDQDTNIDTQGKTTEKIEHTEKDSDARKRENQQLLHNVYNLLKLEPNNDIIKTQLKEIANSDIIKEIDTEQLELQIKLVLTENSISEDRQAQVIGSAHNLNTKIGFNVEGSVKTQVFNLQTAADLLNIPKESLEGELGDLKQTKKTVIPKIQSLYQDLKDKLKNENSTSQIEKIEYIKLFVSELFNYIKTSKTSVEVNQLYHIANEITKIFDRPNIDDISKEKMHTMIINSVTLRKYSPQILIKCAGVANGTFKPSNNELTQSKTTQN
jgi:hypothetical protein